MLATSVREIAAGDTRRFAALAAGTAVFVALIALLAWLVKAGAVINFISESAMVGFKCGVALFLASDLSGFVSGVTINVDGGI